MDHARFDGGLGQLPLPKGETACAVRRRIRLMDVPIRQEACPRCRLALPGIPFLGSFRSGLSFLGMANIPAECSIILRLPLPSQRGALCVLSVPACGRCPGGILLAVLVATCPGCGTNVQSSYDQGKEFLEASQPEIAILFFSDCARRGSQIRTGNLRSRDGLAENGSVRQSDRRLLSLPVQHESPTA